MEKKKEIKLRLGNVIGEMLNSDMECILELDKTVRDMIKEKDYITLSVDIIDEVIKKNLDEFVDVIEGVTGLDTYYLDEIFYNNVYKVFPDGVFENILAELLEYDEILYDHFLGCIEDLVKIHKEEDK